MKRFLSLFLALTLVVGLLTGCDQTPPAVTDPSQSTPPPSQPTSGPRPTDPPQAGDIRISEVMPDNKHLILGGENDWVELYNGGETAVKLDGYTLTDDETKPNQLSLNGLEIPADGYLVIQLDDAAPFRLSAQGETVSLFFGGELVSSLTYGLEEEGRTLDANGPCRYPTPGFANDRDGWVAYLETQTLPELVINEVMTSNSNLYPLAGKCYDMVELFNNSDRPIALGDYTLSDKRSEPARYQFPNVTLQPGEFYVVYCSGNPNLGGNHSSFKLSADGETVYLSKAGAFVDVLQIPALEKHQTYGRVGKVPMYLDEATFGAANSTGKLETLAAPVASHPSGLYSEKISVTLTAQGDIYYTLDGTEPTRNSLKYTAPLEMEGVQTLRTLCVDGSRTASAAYTYVVGQTHELPVLVVEIPQDALTGEFGVLNHIDENYEYQAMMTLIEGGEEQFSVPFGFRLHGNDSRKCPKQNFQVRFRSDYGCSKLRYPLFDDREYSEFKSLLLKGGSEDWYSTCFRDELATGLVNGVTELYTQAMKPVVLYLAGEYWGVYYIRERFSADYVGSNFDVDPESVDLVECTFADIQAGDNREFLALREYCETHDMSMDENYDYLCSKIDVTSLMDWYISRTFLADTDLANIRSFRSLEADGIWRWCFFDLDWSFIHREGGLFSSAIRSLDGERTLMRAVIAYPRGRDAFLRRYGELLKTVFREERMDAAVDAIVAQIASEMPRDRQRWGKTMEGWQNGVEALREFYRDDCRQERVKRDLKNYFSLTDAQMQEYFG